SGPAGQPDRSDLRQRRPLVRGNVITLVALDLVLRVGRARVMRVALVIEVGRVDLDDSAADMPCFGIPADMVADLESLTHCTIPLRISLSLSETLVQPVSAMATRISASISLSTCATPAPPPPASA